MHVEGGNPPFKLETRSVALVGATSRGLCVKDTHYYPRVTDAGNDGSDDSAKK